jgi:hypothetical protein
VWLSIALPLQLAAETLYVNSENTPLNVRSGPGTDNAIVARLEHGTQVSLLERWSVWARITTPAGETAGWVLQRYLTPVPRSPAASLLDMSVEEEQRRFTRLQRTGVLTVQRAGSTGVLRLTIQPLVWRHLTPQEQHNFLQRAQRLFGGVSVDISASQTGEVLARLMDTGAFEAMAVSARTPMPAGSPPAHNPVLLTPPASPRAP